MFHILSSNFAHPSNFDPRLDSGAHYSKSLPGFLLFLHAGRQMLSPQGRLRSVDSGGGASLSLSSACRPSSIWTPLSVGRSSPRLLMQTAETSHGAHPHCGLGVVFAVPFRESHRPGQEGVRPNRGGRMNGRGIKYAAGKDGAATQRAHGTPILGSWAQGGEPVGTESVYLCRLVRRREAAAAVEDWPAS